jgi:hypothetical protein
MSAAMSRPASDSNTPMTKRSVDELDVAIGRLVREMNSHSYRMLVLVREFDDRFGWKKWGYKCCAEWLSWRASISLSAAREKLRTAHALRSLPAIAEAFAEGRLSYSKARALTRVAQLHDEDLLLAYALNANVARVEERCRQIRNVAPDSAHHARRAWSSRTLTAWRDEARGLLRLTVEVPIEEGELIMRALDCAVAAGDVATGIDPDVVAESKGTAWRAQQADALVALAESYLSGGHGEGGATADRYQVVVHADLESLTRGVGRSDLPIDTVKRLLCDCSVVTVSEDGSGNPLDVGRRHRTVSTPLRRALHARDRGCTFPGCHRDRYVQGHHLKHWIDGGETSRDNMTLLCRYHHRMLHEGGFSIVKETDGALRFVTADGRTIPRQGYRLEDFVDDEVGGEAPGNPSREGFREGAVLERDGVREPRAVYRVHAASALARAPAPCAALA